MAAKVSRFVIVLVMVVGAPFLSVRSVVANPDSQCNPRDIGCVEGEHGVVIGWCTAVGGGGFACVSALSGKGFLCNGFVGHYDGAGSAGVGTGCSPN